MNSIFAEDPWENGWNDRPMDSVNSTIARDSTPDVRNNDHDADPNDDVDALLVPLVRAHKLTDYQRRRIREIAYDHGLYPASLKSNFDQICGLIALELDGSGADYTTLQMRRGNLTLDSSIIAIMKSAESDPLNAVTTGLNNASLNELTPGLDHSALGDSSVLGSSVLSEHRDKHDVDNIQDEGDVDDRDANVFVNSIRESFRLVSNPKVSIKEVPEREGLIFKHINYVINTPKAKVLRRYSDFVWLLEVLLFKYPCRVIPGLPPKKFSVGASPDSQFLQRRRRGLHRFLNQVLDHPVLLVEPVVVSFMTVPTDLATWRKQARIDTSVEFQGEKILADFIQKVWPAIGSRFSAQWSKAEVVIAKAIETWTKIVVLVERHEKRQQLMAMDNDRFVETVTTFSKLNKDLYGNNEDLATINDSLDVISESFSKTSQSLVDESYVVNTVVLEKFKNYVDYLYSFQELCERVKRLRTNTIAQLETRIKENEGKYRLLSTDSADAKSSELARLKTAIVNDKQELFQQMNREWLIKQRCLEEYVMFQETQYLVSEAWMEWTRGRVKFQHKLTSLMDNLGQEIVDNMPTAHDGSQFTF